MLKRVIKYEDFDGEEQSEIFYFNLSKPELLTLEVEHKQGYGAMLQKIVDTKDNKELIKQFKDIILLAYGVKSDDGKRFIKNDQLREEFSQTAAYSALFMELASGENADAAVVFLTGILPRDLAGNIDSEELKAKTAEKLGTKASTPPAPPTNKGS